MKIACVILAGIAVLPRMLFAQAPSTRSQLSDGAVIEACHGESPAEKVTTQDRMPEIPADKFDEVLQYFASDGQVKPKFQATNDDIPF